MSLKIGEGWLDELRSPIRLEKLWPLRSKENSYLRRLLATGDTSISASSKVNSAAIRYCGRVSAFLGKRDAGHREAIVGWRGGDLRSPFRKFIFSALSLRYVEERRMESAR